MSTSPHEVLASLWQEADMPVQALAYADLTGLDPVFPSTFAVGTAAQATIAAAALAACEFGHVRGMERQRVAVEMTHAAVDCTAWFSIDGKVPDLWDPFSGLYATADGHVRIHANFRHHRDGALRLLGLDPGSATKKQVEEALLQWRALDHEAASADAGLVATAARTFEEWDATAQGQAVASLPLMQIERIDTRSTTPALPLPLPLPLPGLRAGARPLSGIRVLDLTRILAGPVGGRALAAYGADVMLVNSPSLPNIDAIADTSRGKLSALVDLQSSEGKSVMQRLLGDAHVFIQGYRPGAIEALGFGPSQVAALRPGIVYISLSAYGRSGPWSRRRGFDSLVQTAMGFNHAEAAAAGGSALKPMPMQILDEATGYLIAFGAAAALRRQQLEGGSWHVQVSLAQTGHWLRGLGRVPGGLAQATPDFAPYLDNFESGFGDLRAVRHSARLHATEAAATRPSVPPGTHEPHWPPVDDGDHPPA